MLLRNALLGVARACSKYAAKGAGGSASGQLHPVPHPLRFLWHRTFASASTAVEAKVPAAMESERCGWKASNARWMKGEQWGLRPEDSANTDAFFERLHAKMKARNPPRRADVIRFLMQCKSKEDVMKGVTLLKAYRLWMPKLEPEAGGLLIRACLRAGDLDMALEILSAHRQLRAALSKAVCNDLLIELGKAARIDDMLAAFSYMRTAQPDVISTPTLNILAAGLANVGNVSKALELVLQMRAEGGKTDARSYRMLLKGCNKAMEDPTSRPAAEKARIEILKLMADEKISDAKCDELLKYTPPAASAEVKEDAPAAETVKKE